MTLRNRDNRILKTILVAKKSDTSISIKLKTPKEPKEEKKTKIAEPIKDAGTTVTIKTDEKKPYLVTNSTGDTVVSYFDDDTVRL